MTEVFSHDDDTHEERRKTKEEIVDEEVTPATKLKGHNKRKLKSMADDGHISMSLRLYKRILLSVSKPSYVLGLGAQNVRFENHEKLHILLRKMMRQHNWAEVSGVLSVLLQGTSKDRCPFANRAKFRASLGLLKHIHGDNDISKKIKHTYDIWSKRVKPSKDQRVEDKLMVDLEHIVTQLALGDDDAAFDGAFGLKQLNEFRNLPMSYMFMGLTNYQRLYSGIRKTWQLEDSVLTYFPSTSDMSGHKLVSHDGYFEWQESIHSDNADTRFQCCSSVSVNNDERISIENDSNQQNEVSMEVDAKIQSGNSPVFVQPLNTYNNSEDSDVSFDRVNDQMDYAHYAKTFSILVKQGLDPWLFPLRLPDSDTSSDDASNSDENNEILSEMHEKIVKDNYKDAVKYLWQALHSEPPILPALLPYIQLLMIGGQVHEALNELEKFSSSSAALPSRLRASIMECYDRNNHTTLASCFEDTLKKDPTCSHSMAKLIGIHQTGNYNTESLLEMIALHLDCTYAGYNIWREFAQCFLRFSDDLLSVCLNENADGQRERISIRYDKVPELFTKRNSKKSWTVRCKWWMRRHFNKKMLASDSTAGNLQLLAYKASCASHIYGRDFHYVIKARECLQRENSSDLLKFLVMHMKNSIGLYYNLVLE